MANTAVDIGTGATLTFSESTLALNWTSISVGEISRDVIDTTHLGTTGQKTAMNGDLINHSAITIDFQWDNENGPGLSASSDPEQLTITWPQSLENTTSAATYIGTGFITKIVYPTFGVEELQMGQIEFTPDGATDFAYTDGA